MSDLFDDDELTEFDWLTPTRVDLVGAAANKFTALVAKSEPSRDPIRSALANVKPVLDADRKLRKKMKTEKQA